MTICFSVFASSLLSKEINPQKTRIEKKYSYQPMVRTCVGVGFLGHTGDGGPALYAGLDCAVNGLAFDSQGNLYFSESYFHDIRKVDKYGVIGTFAGGGTFVLSAEGTPATISSINNPLDLTISSKGNMYVSENSDLVLKIDKKKIIKLFAGYGGRGFGGDGGPAINAKLNTIGGLAVDGSENLYISDMSNNRIRKIDSHGIITTIAGTGKDGFSGDGREAINADLNAPSGIVVDKKGNVVFIDSNNYRIRKIDKKGIIKTIAGCGVYGLTGDGGSAIYARIAPEVLTIDHLDNLYFGDKNGVVRKVNKAGIIKTVIGDPRNRKKGIDEFKPVIPSQMGLAALAVDSSNNLYSSDGEYQIQVADLGKQILNIPVPLKQKKLALQKAVSMILTDDFPGDNEYEEKVLLKYGSRHESDEMADEILKGKKHRSFRLWEVVAAFPDEKGFRALLLFIQKDKNNDDQSRSFAISYMSKFNEKSFETRRKKVLMDLFLGNDSIDASAAFAGLKPILNKDPNLKKFVFKSMLKRNQLFEYKEILKMIGSPALDQKTYDVCMSMVDDAINDSDKSVYSYAIWLTCMVGDRDSINELKKFIGDADLNKRLEVWDAILKIAKKNNVEAELPNQPADLYWLGDASLLNQDMSNIFNVLNTLNGDIGVAWIPTHLKIADPKTDLGLVIDYLSRLNTDDSNTLLSQISNDKFYDFRALKALGLNHSDKRLDVIKNILVNPNETKEITAVKKEAIRQICADKLQVLGKYILPYIGIKDYEKDVVCLKGMEIDGKGQALLTAYKDGKLDRGTLLNLLDNLNDGDEKAIVLKALNDSDLNIREMALSRICEDAGKYEWCFDLLRKNLKSSDDKMSEIAVNRIRSLMQKNTPDEKPNIFLDRLTKDERKIIGNSENEEDDQ